MLYTVNDHAAGFRSILVRNGVFKGRLVVVLKNVFNIGIYSAIADNKKRIN